MKKASRKPTTYWIGIINSEPVCVSNDYIRCKRKLGYLSLDFGDMAEIALIEVREVRRGRK